MSIAALHELSTETRRLAIAGASLAPGDFRLQKLIKPLQKSAEKSPVFAKVAEAVKSVVEADEKSAAKALLDLSTLTNAILYTQGKTSIEGELKNIETSPVEGTTTRTSYRILAPLIEALTQTGQGRYEVVANAVKRGAFRDIRLVQPAIVALGDRYGELATLVTDEVLPSFGPGIADLLANDLDPKGGVIHARRLRALSKVDPDRAREVARVAMPDATKEVRIAALQSLKGSEQDADLILEETGSKVKDVRRAAYSALVGISSSAATAMLNEAVGTRDLELLAETVGEHLSDELVTTLVNEGGEHLDDALTNKSPKQKTLDRISQTLRALAGKMTGPAEDFLLKVFEQRGHFSKLRQVKVAGEALNEEVATLMCTIASDRAKLHLIDESDTLPASQIGFALIASAQTNSPKTVFKNFSPLLTDKTRGDLVAAVVGGWSNHNSGVSGHLRWEGEKIKWDPGWLKAAIKADRLPLVCSLLKGPDRTAQGYLTKKLKLNDKAGLTASTEVLQTLVRIGHKGSAKLVLQAVKSSLATNSYYWQKWHYLNLISELPATALKEVETFVKKLPEKQMEEILPYLAELKANTARKS